MKWGVILLFLGLSALQCWAQRMLPKQLTLRTSNCRNLELFVYDTGYHVQPLQTQNHELLLRYGYRNLSLATMLGIATQLATLYQLEQADAQQAAKEAVRQQLVQRIELVALEEASVVAELACIGQRMDQLASALESSRSTVITRYTIASLVAAAIFGVGSAITNVQNPNPHVAEDIALAGSALSVGLSAGALFANAHIELYYPHNLLRDVWREQPTSQYYPPSVWYFLAHPDFSDENNQSLRQRLLERWKGLGKLGAPGSRRRTHLVKLYFEQDGGRYTASELRVHAELFHQLEADIQLMDQDLRSLLNQVLR